ncbi:hypothetical protein L3X38_036138 [Prunus dulcis]|uniref:Pectinesterase n=1 Tax=Prunus dulcis TaxID=3755 RepID=A0AAD4YP70_PRUDU|nr:hypothetical protein L3X38_036138 [Prunus dulcis]
MTQAQFSEQQFMKWVRFVGRLKHSVFKTAKNKLFPSYTLHVTKNRADGDFRTIQDAIDSLPFINLLRVVIKVHAGVYTCVILTPKLYRYRTNTDLARYVFIVFMTRPTPEFPWKPEQIPSYYRHHPDTGPTY